MLDDKTVQSMLNDASILDDLLERGVETFAGRATEVIGDCSCHIKALAAEREELNNELVKRMKDNVVLASEIYKRRLVQDALHLLYTLPTGIGPEEVDVEDTSPEDATWHVGSLAAKKLIEALGDNP